MAGVDHVAQELVRILLSATPEVLGKNPETALDLQGRVRVLIHAQRPHNPLFQNAKRTVARQIACAKIETNKEKEGGQIIRAAGEIEESNAYRERSVGI